MKDSFDSNPMDKYFDVRNKNPNLSKLCNMAPKSDGPFHLLNHKVRHIKYMQL